MKFEVELPDGVSRFYVAYSEAFKQSTEETMKQVLSDFAFGAIDLGFETSERK